LNDKNELIYRIRQIIGDEKEDGFYTSLEYNGEIVNVPNYLFRDGPAKYPEIRISPFLSNELKAHPIRVTSHERSIKREFYDTIFQLDIFAENIVLANRIEETIRERIDLFYDLDTVIYGYDKDFKLIDEEKMIYHHKGYNINTYKIISVYFGNIALEKVYTKEELHKRNTYYIDETGLYINTVFNIKMVQLNTVLNGLIFPDGETANKKGIIKTRILNRRNLSELEKNNVERVSLELKIFYMLDLERNTGPIATDIIVDSD
jgi:hypothetical protein